MILGILPETCDVEIIFPTNDVNSLAEITKPASTILLIVFGKTPIEDFNGSSRTVQCKTSPIDSLARLPYPFLFICDKPCLTKISFYCFSYFTTRLVISFYGLAIVKETSNAYALMTPMFFQSLKRFGEKVTCER